MVLSMVCAGVLFCWKEFEVKECDWESVLRVGRLNIAIWLTHSLRKGNATVEEVSGQGKGFHGGLQRSLRDARLWELEKGRDQQLMRTSWTRPTDSVAGHETATWSSSGTD